MNSINNKIDLPFYAKATILLIGFIALFAILYIAKSIIIPLVFAFIIAILLHPGVNFFVRKKINRIVAIVMMLLFTFIIIAAFGAFLFSQASMFSESWPKLVDRVTMLINRFIAESSGYYDVNPQKMHDWITKMQDEFIETSRLGIGQTLVSVGNLLMVIFLVPVYVYIILYYYPLLIDFINKVFGETNRIKVREVVSQIKVVIQRYLIGLIIEVFIVGAMNSIGLLIIGIEYAILLGMLGALLNIIPYIGGVVAVAMPMMVALATHTTLWPAIYVLILYAIVQLIDNNYIIPLVVSSKVKINALFSIIVVIAGNALWGIPGMFLAIPMLAIVKLIFDHIEPLQPWGFLLGDTMPPVLIIKNIRLKRFKNKTL